ncbi:MAG: hypothetical protein ACLUUF_06425 [Bifidobacterium pullorum]
MPNRSFSDPTRPYFAPYMKPQIIVETTAGTAYGRNVLIRKNFAPCSFIESMHSAITADRNSMTGTCTTVNNATLPHDAQNWSSPNRRM